MNDGRKGPDAHADPPDNGVIACDVIHFATQPDAQKAADIYAAVANDTSVDASFRDMATVLGSVEMLDVSKDNAEAVISRLQPLTSPNNNWRHSARETIAVAAISLGKLDLAREQLQAIGSTPPTTILPAG